MTDVRLAGPVTEHEAGETLLSYRAVAVISDLAYLASYDNLTQRDAVRGITVVSALTGELAKVQVFGPVVFDGWNWTPGKPVYLGMSGALSHTPPDTGYVLRIGAAESPTRLFVELRQPILQV